MKYILISVITLCNMDKLPDEPLLNHTIKEAELITKSLDPILNGMLNDHDTDHTLCGKYCFNVFNM